MCSQLIVPLISAQTADDYSKAGWMTIRMYGGNRSGYGPNWLIMDHGRGYDFVKDADGSYDLTGGWHDCGDHVKFGQTQFYAGYMLLLGYSAFPRGYDDYYSFDYSGYKAAGDFSWEGKKGKPNGIPDILDEVKYATDYYIKCARDGSTFYSQVGNGNKDHMNWTTSVNMAQLSNGQGGEADGTREIKKNPKDASMASYCGATLALMSRMYRHFDEAYASKCLQHALFAYEYAKANQTNSGGGTITGSFYNPDNDWKDNYVCLCTELYLATEDEKYKEEALSFSADIEAHDWVLDYENGQDLAAYALARLGDQNGVEINNTQATLYKSKANSGNVMEVGAAWGKLRYSCSAAFVLALQHSLNNDGEIAKELKGTIDYVLGYNSTGQSFVVGFGSKSPRNPHHRNVFLSDREGASIPARNSQHGYLVGGSFTGSFPDDIHDYQTSEGGIDYNAGLVGAIAYIRSIVAPVDREAKFGIKECEKPDLGSAQTLCGKGEATIGVTQAGGNSKYSWQRNGSPISGTTPTITVTEAGTYTLIVDTDGCIAKGSVEVIAEIPDISLKSSYVLKQSTVELNTGLTGQDLTFEWSHNDSPLSSETGSSIEAAKAGNYAVTVNGAGCESKSAQTILTTPPAFTFTSTDITIDGEKDESFVNQYPIETKLEGTAGTPNIYATWSGLWNNNNLYIFITVTDNDLSNDSGGNWYHDDAIEICFDGGNEKASSYDSNDRQVAFAWNSSSVIQGSNNQSSVSGIDFAMKETADGYTLEVSVPLSSLQIAPSIGTDFGFDIGINDDDNGGERDNKISWYQTVDDGWKDPSVFGEVVLKEEAAPIVTEVTQTIALKAGWNLISFYSLPEDTSVENVLADAIDQIIEIKDNHDFYRPKGYAPFNKLETVSFQSSYLINMNAAKEITITGNKAKSTSTSLNAGWNMVGYPLDSETALQTIISGNIKAVKNFDKAYEQGQTNSLDIFKPGEGYFIKADSPTSINW